MNAGESLTVVLPSHYSAPIPADEWDVAGATYQVVKCERHRDGLLEVGLMRA
jgi:hypothetical protein